MEEAAVSNTGEAAADWRLRSADMEDLDALLVLTAKPAVYRFMFDGAAPVRAVLAERLAQFIESAAACGLGLWMLEQPDGTPAGAVWLEPDLKAKQAEVSYLLDPAHWGQGLALRMAWTAVTLALRHPGIDVVFAGADKPNAASIAVMQHLGMRFRRDVTYPLGPGVEYELTRNDLARDALGPQPRPDPLPVVGNETKETT